MSIRYRYITLLLLLPLGLVAQRTNGKQLMFYTDLAFKDAHHEQTVQHYSVEDELDFWKDQISFEQSLKANDKWAYQMYLNGKRKAYANHQESCTDTCNHSDLYFRQASYYSINGVVKPTERLVYSLNGND